MLRERLALWSLLLATFAVRAIYPEQPIVENYVGRQIPTAMVARNLERGSGFLNPQLDTGPFPNLFLVEPPIYAQLVASVRPLIGFDLEPTGRLVSAAATMLAAWGLFGLVRRRESWVVALLALGSFGIFPVMIRYGRAFQPDALMLGCILAGLRGWDEFEDRGDWRWAAFGGFVLSTGLALKVTSAWALIPFVLIVRRWPIGWRWVASVSMLMPAIAWYAMAWDRVASSAMGSLASSENARIWARSFSLTGWLRFATYADLGRNMVVRSFTPVGFVLAIWGLLGRPCKPRTPVSHVGWAERREPHRDSTVGLAATDPPHALPSDMGRKGDGLWLGWGLGCGLSILGLASKWHHSYYWVVVAPLAAVGVARGLACLAKLGRSGGLLAAGLGSALLGLCLFQSVSTWRTPVEWANLVEAADEIKRRMPLGQLVIAPEALLYYADCRGYRLEFEPAAMSRAAFEWSGDFFASVVMKRFGLTPGETSTDRQSPLSLVYFYQRLHDEDRIRSGSLEESFGSWFPDAIAEQLLVADIGSVSNGSRRQAWREAIRNQTRLTILIDRPDFFLAESR